MRILVVDDERAVRESLRRALELEGYEIELAGDGSEALYRLESSGEPDAMILDVLMPGVDGLEVCRRIRGTGSKLPVLMLTARTEIEDRVAGLDAGADDYVTKPFALEELLARVRALLRRASEDDDEVLRFADLELDPGTREVRRGDRQIELTRTEFSLLELFLRNARQVLTRSVIFERVWGYDFGFGSNSLDVYIGYLRRKTEAAASPGSSTRCAASATRCASHELPRAARLGRRGSGRARGRRCLGRRLRRRPRPALLERRRLAAKQHAPDRRRSAVRGRSGATSTRASSAATRRSLIPMATSFGAPARNWSCRSTGECKRWPAVSEGRSSRTRTQKGHVSA